MASRTVLLSRVVTWNRESVEVTATPSMLRYTQIVQYVSGSLVVTKSCAQLQEVGCAALQATPECGAASLHDSTSLLQVECVRACMHTHQMWIREIH